MPTYQVFGATADDVLRRLPGEMNHGEPSLIEAALADAEARVEAALPERYRRLLRRVEGEVIVPAAAEGQLTAAVGLPQASGLALFADLAGPYSDRTAADALDPAAYHLDDSGEFVVFDPGLPAGTRVMADYDTSLSGGSRSLAELASALAATALARVAGYGRPEWVESLARDAAERLDALADGRIGVPELDALRLADDWERAPRGIRVGQLVRN